MDNHPVIYYCDNCKYHEWVDLLDWPEVCPKCNAKSYCLECKEFNTISEEENIITKICKICAKKRINYKKVNTETDEDILYNAILKEVGYKMEE